MLIDATAEDSNPTSITWQFISTMIECVSACIYKASVEIRLWLCILNAAYYISRDPILDAWEMSVVCLRNNRSECSQNADKQMIPSSLCFFYYWNPLTSSLPLSLWRPSTQMRRKWYSFIFYFSFCVYSEYACVRSTIVFLVWLHQLVNEQMLQIIMIDSS